MALKTKDTQYQTIVKLHQFTVLLQEHINLAKKLRGSTETAIVFYETGRKFHKVSVVDNGKCHILYFIDAETEIIYGAKSENSPNMKWYYGTLDSSPLWDWSDWYGKPVNDNSVRLVKKYGPYFHYIPIVKGD